MKSPFAKLLLSCLLIVSGLMQAHSQTLNWGSAVFSNLADSKGNALNDTFVFEVGTFQAGFTPDATNAAQWWSNWKIYDQANAQGVDNHSFNSSIGYFTSTADMNPNGTSSSPFTNSSTFSFSGLEGYLWVRNSTGPALQSEWALVHASGWTFPTADPACCPSDLPVEWSLSDLSNEIPKYGSQGGINGDGYHTVTGTYTLQTFSFVPEPSAALLLGIGALLLGRRRRS